LIDGETLVADCERIIRSANRSAGSTIAARRDERTEVLDKSAASSQEAGSVGKLTPVAGGGLPVQLLDAPQLPPQNAPDIAQTPAAITPEPLQFFPAQAPRALHAQPSVSADETAQPSSTAPPRVDPRKRVELRRHPVAVPNKAMAAADLRTMSDLQLMQQLAVVEDRSLARETIDELYRRGFQTKHLRLAELLADPDPNVRLELVHSLPQMSGIDSRPWLLWLSRDESPAVRKAAIAVIATSSDAALLQRVRELEREETDDEVLRVVRQILVTRPTTTLR
jgi:hypothetical protein